MNPSMAPVHMLKKELLRVTVVMLAALASACATNTATMPLADPTPTPPRVTYSTFYANGRHLKETPAEVRVIRRSTTSNLVARQVLINVAMLALGGGIAVNPFGKDDLKGSPIDDVQDRERVRNPVITDFVTALQAHVNDWVASQAGLASRHFKHPIVVGGGHVSLVYETLSEAEEEKFQLKTDIEVFKRRESAHLLSIQPVIRVDCAGASTPARAMADWSAHDYALIRQTLDPMLETCAQRVLAQLDKMLED